MPIDFSRISADALRNLNPDLTVFFFVVAPLEDHGPHLPLGSDLLEAQTIAQMTAERLEKEMPGHTAVMMPSAPLGIESNTTQLAICVRPHVLRDWLVDACLALRRAGFYQFACVSGHLGPKQLTAIEEAGKLIRKMYRFKRRRPVLVCASSALTSLDKVRLSPLWPDPEEHGGRRDTSVALAMKAPVDSNYSSLPPVQRHPNFWTRWWRRVRNQQRGYWGNPANASVHEGQQKLDEAVADIFPKLRAVLEGSNPLLVFKSWYSVFPSNKSFFKAWLLALFALAFMLAWAYMTFPSAGLGE